MLNAHCHELLKMAAAESIERIRRDRAEAPERVKPLLAYLEEHVFDQGLNVKRLLRACCVGEDSLVITFHSAVGQPPRRYIEDLRLETARRLLAETDLAIWQISELVGFSDLAVFSHAFLRRGASERLPRGGEGEIRRRADRRQARRRTPALRS